MLANGSNHDRLWTGRRDQQASWLNAGRWSWAGFQWWVLVCRREAREGYIEEAAGESIKSDWQRLDEVVMADVVERLRGGG